MNETEEALAAIWAEVLRMARVGAADDFFLSGGHSLLAVRMLARVRDAFGVELSPRAVFEAPTVAGLAVRIDAARAAGDRAGAPPIEPAPRDRPLPLSFGQERLWFLWRMAPESPFYNVPAPLRLRRAVDPEGMARALAELAARHEPLRTVFEEAGGAPVQKVLPPGPFALPVEDFSAAPRVGDDLPAALRERIAAEAKAPFDLTRGPVFRAHLFRVAGDDHVLLLNLHHVVADGWSMGILFRELLALYDAFAEGRPSPLPPLPVRYADYAVWQRGWLSGAVLERELEFWRHELAGVPAALELPTDRPRPAVQSFRGATHTFRIPQDVADSLAALARREGATPYMVLLAAFGAVLSRWARQDDVVIGSPVGSRARPEVEGLVGVFINMVPQRVDLSGRPGFRALLRRVRERTLEAFAHQEVPFEHVVEALGVQPDLSRGPVFQAMFVLQNAVAEGGGEGAAEMVWADSETAKYDLTLAVTERADGFSAALEYATDLFDAGTVERIGRHLGTFLAAVAADPDAPVHALPLMDADERRLVVETWNATERPYAKGDTLHGMFEAQAARTPGAPALSFDGVTTSYAALNAKANRIAHYLRSRGVGPESRVGVLLERTPALVAALVGVLKAGAAYVPLDPQYPAERIAFMLEDTAVPVLLTQESLGDVVPPTGAEVVRIDGDRARIDAQPETNPGVALDFEHPAYLIYTSGSTGRPKGVVVRHGSAAVFL
ncbi:MAG TPA: condensation domain-containing protein, partial [Longimicrobium sp.]|nr:condensation domain-containing protein [Longimicrobium sp.]